MIWASPKIKYSGIAAYDFPEIYHHALSEGNISHRLYYIWSLIFSSPTFPLKLFFALIILISTKKELYHLVQSFECDANYWIIRNSPNSCNFQVVFSRCIVTVVKSLKKCVTNDKNLFQYEFSEGNWPRQFIDFLMCEDAFSGYPSLRRGM